MLHSKNGHPKTNPNLSNNSSMVGNLIRPDQLNQIVLSYNPFPTKSKNLGEVVYCIYPGLLDVGGVGSEALGWVLPPETANVSRHPVPFSWAGKLFVFIPCPSPGIQPYPQRFIFSKDSVYGGQISLLW